MVEPTGWMVKVAADPSHSSWYVERFRKMAADGDDLAGEARLVDAMVPRGSARPSSPSDSYLDNQAWTVLRATPNRAATSVTLSPSLITANTARYRCSATLNSLMQGVSRINRSRCNPSAETLSAITRNRNDKHQPR